MRSRIKNSEGYFGFGFNILRRDVDIAGRTATFVASTPQVDRYGDVILQDGWDTRNFSTNPIVLFAHDSRSLPIGKALQLGIDQSGNLTVRIEFSKAIGTYELPEVVLQLVSQRMLNCVSVGFIPLEFEYRFETDEDGNQLPFPSGRIYKKQELLEISVVPVPANPGAVVVSNGYQKAFGAIEDIGEEWIVASDVARAYFTYDALDGMVYQHGSRNPSDSDRNPSVPKAAPSLLVKMYKDGQSRPFVLKCTSPEASVAAVRAMERDSFASQGFLCELAGYSDNELPVYRSVQLLTRDKVCDSKNLRKELTDTKMTETCHCIELTDKAVVPFHHYPLAPSNTTWDAEKEMGSTDKPEDWKKMCTIVVNDGKNKGDYKLPHHKGPASGFDTVRRGVTAALGRVNQVKGASESDKKGARSHLLKHMAEFHKADGKDFDEAAFLEGFEALEALRDIFAEGSEEQEVAMRAITKFAEDTENAVVGTLLSTAKMLPQLSERVRSMVAKMALDAFTYWLPKFEDVERRKFSNETMNKKMERAHKSMSAAKDELHSVHDDATDILGQASSMVEEMFKPAADGSNATDHLGEETVASNLGKAYDMAYEAKQMVRRAASRYGDHMQDAVERLKALVEYVSKKESQAAPPAVNGGDESSDADDEKQFLEALARQASKIGIAASNGLTGTEPAESALTAGLARPEEEQLAEALLKATTADDHAAH